MSNAASGDLLARSCALLLLNARIAAPFALVFFINQTVWLIFHFVTSDANFFGRVCALFTCTTVFILGYTCTIGMMQEAWANKTATFLDGKRALLESFDRVAVVTIAFLSVYALSSGIFKLTLKTQDSSFSVLLASVSILPLVLSLGFVLLFFFLYIGPAVIIGRREVVKSFTESAQISLKNSGSTFTLAITICGVSCLGFMLHLSNFFNGNIFGLCIFLLIFAPASCLLTFLICGQYLSVRGFPAFSERGSQKNKDSYKKISLALAYLAAFSLAWTFTDNGFSIQPRASAASFQTEIGNLSVGKSLENFIIEVRSIKTDRTVEKNAVDNAYAMVVPDSSAYRYLEAWFPTHNPFQAAKRQAKFIYDLKTQQNGPSAYYITWKEAITNPITNAVKHSEKWEANIQLEPNPSLSSSFITGLSWQKRR